MTGDPRKARKMPAAAGLGSQSGGCGQGLMMFKWVPTAKLTTATPMVVNRKTRNRRLERELMCGSRAPA
jgi:hypothetical protein